MDPSTGV